MLDVEPRIVSVKVVSCTFRVSARSFCYFVKPCERPGAYAMIIKLMMCSVLMCSFIASSFGQAGNEGKTAPSGEDEAVAVENSGSAVEVDGRPIFSIYAQVGGFTPDERATGIGQRIVTLSNTRTVPLDAIHAEDRGAWTEVIAGHDRIMAITEADSKAAERPRAELAAEYAEIIRHVVRQYREEHTVRRFLWGVLYSLEATLACGVALVLLFWLRRKLRSWLDARIAQTTAATLHVRSAKKSVPTLDTL